MAKQETRVSARITFKADKVMARMKKCLIKNDKREFVKYPAVEVETGLVVATDGYALAAHRLQDYHCELSENAVLGDMVVLPVEVLQMKGMVTAVVTNNGFQTITTATDEKGATAQVFWSFRYPNWRVVFPTMTGWPFDIDAKAWDEAVKELLPKIEKMGDVQAVHLYADKDSKTIEFSYDNDYPDGQGSTTVPVKWMPHRMGVGFDANRLRNVLALEPDTLRFTDNTRAVIMHNDETLALIMPLNIEVDGKPMVEVPGRERKAFKLAEWVAGDGAAARNDGAARNVDITKRRNVETAKTSALSLADRLRQALLARLAA